MISAFFCLIPFAAAAVMVFGWPIAPDNDLYFHLRAGERVAATGGPLLADIFTYTAPGTPDEAWHSWVSQLIFWKLYTQFGFFGLQVLNLILVWITLGAVCYFVGKRSKSAGAVVLAGTGALLIHQHTQILRPLLFGEALFALSAFVLIPLDKPLSPGRLALSLLVATAWANLHGSAVLLPLLFTAYAFGCWLERNSRSTSYLTLISPLLIFGATLLNPRGAGLYYYSLELTRLGKLAGNVEWGGVSPLSFGSSFAGPLVMTLSLDAASVVIALGLLTTVFLIARGAWATALLCLLCLALPFVSVRHTTYLLFPVACLAAGLSYRRMAVPVLFSLIMLSAYKFHHSTDVTPSLAKTSKFIEEAGLTGNVFCEPSWSSYLLFKNYPSLRVASDNRTLVNKAFYVKASELYRRFGTDAWRIMIEEAPPETDFMLTSSWRETPPFDLSQWLVIYENNHATLAVRRNERNAENVKRVEGYYARQGISFAADSGFTSAEVFAANRTWFVDQTEVMPWGKWPPESLKRVWEEKQRRFYESRKIIGKNPLG